MLTIIFLLLRFVTAHALLKSFRHFLDQSEAESKPKCLYCGAWRSPILLRALIGSFDLLSLVIGRSTIWFQLEKKPQLFSQNSKICMLINFYRFAKFLHQLLQFHDNFASLTNMYQRLCVITFIKSQQHRRTLFQLQSVNRLTLDARDWLIRSLISNMRWNFLMSFLIF